MSAIDNLLRQPAAQVIGWALVHFVWQGALIGVLTALALAALRRSAADIRYVVASIGLSLMLTLPAVTAAQLWRTIGAHGTVGAAESITTPSHAPVAPVVTTTASARQQIVVSAEPAAEPMGLPAIRLESMLPLVVLAW